MKNNILRISLLLVLCLALSLCFFSCKKTQTYTVTFEANNGDPATVLTLEDGATPTLPEDPTRYGFLFAGWFRDAELKEKATPETTPVSGGDVPSFAGWTPAEAYQIKFDTKGGTAIPAASVLKGEALAESSVAAPAKENYTFTGWYTNAACTAKFNFATAPAGNMTLYAGWKLNDGMGEYIGIADGVEVARVAFPAGAPVLPTTGDGVSYIWFSDILMTVPFGMEVSTGSVTIYGMAYTEGLVIENGVVTGYTGRVKNVIVPESWNGVPVTEIAANAFSGKRTLKSVKLPATVVSVGDSAFYGCYSLSEINLSAACTSVGKFAFYGCEKLTTAGDLSGLEEIREHTFAACRRLAAVNFSESLLAVGKYAFADCTALQSVMLPDTVAEIGEYAFSGCKEIKEFRSPASLNDFRTGALKDCAALTKLIPSEGNDTALFRVIDGNLYGAFGKTLVLYVQGEKNETAFTLPAGCTEIAPYAFSGNGNLTALDLSNVNLTLDKGALAGMRALQSLTVYALASGNNAYLAYFFGADSGEANGSAGNYTPATLEKVHVVKLSAELPDYAFYGVTGLREITGIENLRSIGQFAFAYTALSEIELPATLVRIGDSAFYGCASISEFRVKDGNPAYAAFDGCLYNKDMTRLHLVPQLKESVTFPDTVRIISTGAFYKSNVLSLTIPAGVKTIESGALAGVLKLRELTVPFIGGSATDTDNRYMIYIFGGSVTKDGSVQEDGTYSYRIANTSSTPATLKKLTVSGAIAEIPDFAFAYLSQATEINWNDTITAIGDYAFFSTGLTAVQIPNTVRRIGDYAFASGDLENVTVPGSVGGNLGFAIFAGCSNLETVVFEEGVTRIPASAFRPTGSRDSETGDINYYSLLKSITLPASIESIGENAFIYAGTRYIGLIGSTYSNLVFILPANSNLKVIEKGAFYRSSIQSIALPACFEEVGEMAFYGCEALATVTFGNKTDGSALRKLGGAAFAACKGLAEMRIYKDVTTAADVPEIEIYTVSTTTENVTYNVFAGGATPTVYVRSAEIYRNAKNWNEYDIRIFELA